MDRETKEGLIRLAQKQAESALKRGNPPFGAVLADMRGKVVLGAYNTQNSGIDPTAHAETNLLRKACKRLKTLDLSDFCLFSNAEPCSMCMSAAIKAKVIRVYFGAPYEPFMDPDLSALDVAKHAKERIQVEGGILGTECGAQISRGRELLNRPDT